MDSLTVVAGGLSTVTELGKDEAWLGGWLREQPTRLGLGELEVSGGEPSDDARSFAATDDDRCFSVDVQLGEIEPSRGFGALDNWARNRVQHPDKTHVAVLVTEAVGDRYETTLQALAEHLPLVVVELQVWRGESEAIVVPRIALASEQVDVSDAPAARVAEAGAAADTPEKDTTPASGDDTPAEEDEPASEDDFTAAAADDVSVPDDKDDTGVADPWGPPSQESAADDEAAAEGDDAHRLLSTVG
jgi:hypothetical protein